MIMRCGLMFCFALMGGCGASPEQACRDTVAVSCHRIYECFSAQKSEPSFQREYGTSEAECLTLGTQKDCKGDSAGACVGYQQVAASCQAELNRASCAEFAQGAVRCDLRCP